MIAHKSLLLHKLYSKKLFPPDALLPGHILLQAPSTYATPCASLLLPRLIFRLEVCFSKAILAPRSANGRTTYVLQRNTGQWLQAEDCSCGRKVDINTRHRASCLALLVRIGTKGGPNM